MTQKTKVLDHLKLHKTITPLDALNLYGCFRLGAVIFDLRQEGHNITTETNKGDKKYAIYTFIPPVVENTELPLWD